MLTKCPNCDNSELEVLKCLKCGGVDFIEQKLAIQKKPQAKDLLNYEYVCFSCGSTLELPEPNCLDC